MASNIVKLKDYLLDDLSSCSSNGFTSYPRRQCFIEIHHIKLLKPKQKSKSPSVLQKASAVVVNVFKKLHLDKPRRNLSGFWKRRSDHGEKELKITSTSNSSVSSLESYFSPTYDSSTTNVPLNHIAKEKKNTTDSKNEKQNEEKDQFSPISVMDFSCGKDDDDDDDDDDEVTSPFQHSHFCDEGTKRKLMPKAQRIKNLTQLKPVRLEDRIMLSECRAHESSLQGPREFVDQTERKAIALLQQLKTTMPSHSHSLFESTITENILLGFFREQINEGNVSNFTILQVAKDWMNGQVRETFDSQMTMLTYTIRDMEKKAKWSKYEENEVEKREIGLDLEYEVFTCLIREVLLDFRL